MKSTLFLGVLTMAMLDVAYAAEPSYSEVEIISVVPRSPDVKPFVMSVPAEGRHKQAESATPAAKVLVSVDAQTIPPKAPKQ